MRRLIIAGAVALTALVAVATWDYLKFSGRFLAPITPVERANAILVEKQKRQMTLLRDGTPFKTYAVSLGKDPIGHKREEGDGRTPEGSYKIDSKNERSRFHLALHISYPETADKEQARQRGVSPGGDIMIHGLPNGLGWLRRWHLARDWTDGCIAVTNAEIEEIWASVAVGTTIEIRP